MRTIPKDLVIRETERIIIEAATVLDDKVVCGLQRRQSQETLPIARHILDEILENQNIARTENIPICQDTGVAVFFVDIGYDLHFDYDLDEALNEGVRRGYQNGYLRKSVVAHPLNRKNTRDNTPAIIHHFLVSGDRLRIRFAPKGAGSENMSRLKMLTPADGVPGIVDFVLETVKLAGGKACPPLILGVGIGGNFETSAILAKEALFRPLEDEAENPLDRDLEKQLLEAVNDLGIGPMGLGGKTTCLAVKVNSFACHIASLPVAVNLQCHAARHQEITL
jgi:fumarate hydratase subunit alpha